MEFSTVEFNERFQEAVTEAVEKKGEKGEVYILETEFGGRVGYNQFANREVIESLEDLNYALLKAKVDSMTGGMREFRGHWFGDKLKVGDEPELFYEIVYKAYAKDRIIEQREQCAYVRRIA